MNRIRNGFKRNIDYLRLNDFNWKAVRLGVLAAVFIFIVVILMGMIVTNVTETEDISNSGQLEEQYPNYMVLFVVIVVFSMIEEIVFRGYILHAIMEWKKSSFLSVMGSALVFGFFHIGYGKPYTVFVTIFMGIVLGYLVVKTNNLYTSISGHLFYNLMVFWVTVLNSV